jgi:hypothetical protein
LAERPSWLSIAHLIRFQQDVLQASLNPFTCLPLLMLDIVFVGLLVLDCHAHPAARI